MFKSLELLTLTGLLFVAETAAGGISPPQNLSLRWKDEFKAELRWQPPPLLLADCKYLGEKITNNSYSRDIDLDTQDTSYINDDLVDMNGGFLRYTLTTVCGDNESEPAVLEISYPDLVKSLDCYLYNSSAGRCSWSPARSAPDLRFYYRLDEHYGSNSRKRIQECSSYIYTGDVKTGCDFPATINTIIGMLFNATLNNTVVRNTYFNNKIQVKPPAPVWEVIKSEKHFNINWTPPDIPVPWEIKINYTECNTKETISLDDSTSHKLQRASHCRYCFQIEAVNVRGNSPLSDKKCFDADTDLLWLVCTVVVFLIVTLAVVIIVCCHRNKDNIWPKVPVPPDSLKVLTENNNESSFRKLYIPVEEEENCIVTLATDTQTKKPNY